jgi:predicted enzyme related to lactoylglutathione lyase
MTNPSTGRFTWHETMTTDVPASVAFYTSLFGWKTEVMDMGTSGKYTLFLAGDKGVGGCLNNGQPGVPSHWLVYVGSDDVDATAKKVTESGGKILVPPMDIPSMVRFAVAMDPQGAAFGIVKNLDPKADVAPPAVSPPGTFTWDELHTSDPDAAAAFYGKVFGWTGKVGEKDPSKYFHIQNAGKDIGGMLALKMPNVPPNWVSYIAVSDVDAMVAKAKELGGRTLMDAMDMPNVGRFAFMQDPTGAAFALFRSAHV